MATVAASGFAFAQPPAQPGPQARVALGVGQSDNLNRSEASPVDSEITRLQVGFRAGVDRLRLRGGVAGDLQFLKYATNEIADDDEVLGSVDGSLALHVVPDRFYWDVQYNYGQTRVNFLGPVSPDNRQTTTVASTGPELALPLGERNSLEFGARVSESNYERTPEFDARLTTVRLGLVREVDSVTSVSLNLEGRENEFDSALDVYEFEVASFEYRRELASGQAVASLGRGRVEIGSESQPTTVVGLAWNREVGARSRLEICAGRELTDAGSVFAAGGGAVGCQGELSGLANVSNTTDGRLQGVILSESPARRQSLGVRFDVDGELGGVTLMVGVAQDRFEVDAGRDNDTSMIQLSGSRRFGQVWLLDLSIQRWDQDFIETGAKYEDQYARLALSRVLARNAFLEFSLERNRRAGFLLPFDENRVFLTLGRTFQR